MAHQGLGPSESTVQTSVLPLQPGARGQPCAAAPRWPPGGGLVSAPAPRGKPVFHSCMCLSTCGGADGSRVWATRRRQQFLPLGGARCSSGMEGLDVNHRGPWRVSRSQSRPLYLRLAWNIPEGKSGSLSGAGGSRRKDHPVWPGLGGFVHGRLLL